MPYNPDKPWSIGKMTPGGGYDPGSGGNFQPLIPPASQGMMPDWSTLPQVRDPLKNTLKPGFEFDPSGLAGYQNLLDLATGTGLSQYGQAATDALQTQLGFEKQDATTAGQSAIQQAMGNLARGGGITSGARERIQTMGARDLMKNRQGLSRAGLLGMADISMKDAAGRQKALGGLIDLGSGAEQFNLSNLFADVGSQRGYETDKARLELEKYMAEKKAAEMEGKAGGGGGGGGVGDLLGWAVNPIGAGVKKIFGGLF